MERVGFVGLVWSPFSWTCPWRFSPADDFVFARAIASMHIPAIVRHPHTRLAWNIAMRDLGAENSAAPRKPLRDESVTYVSGTFCYLCLKAGQNSSGGGRGIRTPDTLSGISVFKTDCFNRSHIPPREGCQQFTSSRKAALILHPRYLSPFNAGL